MLKSTEKRAAQLAVKRTVVATCYIAAPFGVNSEHWLSCRIVLSRFHDVDVLHTRNHKSSKSERRGEGALTITHLDHHALLKLLLVIRTTTLPGFQ